MLHNKQEISPVFIFTQMSEGRKMLYILLVDFATKQMKASKTRYVPMHLQILPLYSGGFDAKGTHKVKQFAKIAHGALWILEKHHHKSWK